MAFREQISTFVAGRETVQLRVKGKKKEKKFSNKAIAKFVILRGIIVPMGLILAGDLIPGPWWMFFVYLLAAWVWLYFMGNLLKRKIRNGQDGMDSIK